MKVCKKCGIEKSLDSYFKNKKGKLGLRSECKECTKLFKANNPEIKAGHLLKWRYGISLDDYLSLLKKQNNSCAICGTSACESGNKFSVDHNHLTGQVRGLLCNPCNNGLGRFRDNPEIIKTAYQYLIEKGHYGQQVA